MTNLYLIKKITAIGNENFSTADIDQNSGKSIVTIDALLKIRIGQSFFAKVTQIFTKKEHNYFKILWSRKVI